jgi:hypothetical protein
LPAQIEKVPDKRIALIFFILLEPDKNICFHKSDLFPDSMSLEIGQEYPILTIQTQVCKVLASYDHSTPSNHNLLPQWKSNLKEIGTLTAIISPFTVETEIYYWEQ